MNLPCNFTNFGSYNLLRIPEIRAHSVYSETVVLNA